MSFSDELRAGLTGFLDSVVYLVAHLLYLINRLRPISAPVDVASYISYRGECIFPPVKLEPTTSSLELPWL